MKGRSTDWLLALAGGALLAVMIDFNSLMAKHSSPLFASWVAHGIGSVAALVLIALGAKIFGARKKGGASAPGTETSAASAPQKAPSWAYLGGVPGALTVVLAAIAVNSGLALSGTLALMLVGQVLFGIVCDRFGLFGIPRRRLGLTDLFVVGSVLAGSAILIFFRS